MPLLRPLLLSCFPETGLFTMPDTLEASPDLVPWEVGVSRSAQEKGYLRPIASAFRFFTEADTQRLVDSIASYDLVVVSPLSLNSLAKTSLGIRDSMPSTVLAEAIFKGIPVFLDSTIMQLCEKFSHPHFARVYRNHWNNLETGLVKGFTPDSLALSVRRVAAQKSSSGFHNPDPGCRDVVTREDIIAAWNAATPVTVKRGALITDLAREEAEKLGIPIKTIG